MGCNNVKSLHYFFFFFFFIVLLYPLIIDYKNNVRLLGFEMVVDFGGCVV
jgi:hypothetical protein